MAGGFVDLIVWREAASLTADVIRLCGRLRGPASASAADQMIRAAESIPANIAEGYGRGVNKDCVRFLKVARASASELESHLRVASAANRLTTDTAHALITHTCRVRYLLNRFIVSVEARARSPRP